MLNTVAQALSALAIWKYTESDTHAAEVCDQAELKAHQAQAYEQFVVTAYMVAFALVPWLVGHDLEITTQNAVRYSAALDPANVSTENWLQLMMDLPGLIQVMGAR